MAKAPLSTVSIIGLDVTLLRIEGKFSTAIDKKVLNLQGRFIKEMDKAASQVFKSMAVDTKVHGNVARRVMGSHAGTPSYLVAEGAKWEPLSKNYLRRKKRLMSGDSKDKMNGKVSSTHFWEYTGSLRKAFRVQTEKMARMSNNTLRNSNIQNGKGSVYSEHQKNKPKDELFTPIKSINARGGNRGTRAKNYDFVYDETASSGKISYSATHKNLTGIVPEKSVKQMNRYLEFDVFRGYAEYIKDTIEGKKATNPETYIAGLSAGRGIVGAKNRNGTYNAQTKNYERKLEMGFKLFYKKNGVSAQRQMIQPYIRYYFKKIMVPLAKKLVQGM